MQDFFNVQALRDWRVSVVDYDIINSRSNRMRASWKLGILQEEVVAIDFGLDAGLAMHSHGDFLQLENGKMFCTNKGEFGGGVVWIRDAPKEEVTLLKRPTSHLFPWIGGILAIGGLSHMSIK